MSVLLPRGSFIRLMYSWRSLCSTFADFAVPCLLEEVEKRIRDCRMEREGTPRTSVNTFDVTGRCKFTLSMADCFSAIH